MKSLPARLPSFLAATLAFAALLLAGCDYDVPLTEKPSGPIDQKLLGNWLSPEGWMMVRSFDADHYVVSYNGAIYRGWHSTVAGRSFITLHSLDAQSPKFTYVSYSLGNDQRRLDVRVVRDEVLSKEIKDSAAMRKALEQVVPNPALLTEVTPFTRMIWNR
jgi:hypothetical protein